MRWNLMQSFDKIYTIDLHGNSKKKEVCPDGSVDQNVFDIMQGVSINLFIKTGKKKEKELGQIFHYDLFGKRDLKYDFLSENSLKDINYQELKPNSPNYFFIPKNEDGRNDYESGLKVDELFTKNVSGIVTMGDEFAFSETKIDILNRLNEFKNKDISESDLKTKYNLGKNYAEFILKNKEELKIEDGKIIKCSYRPFDNRWTYFDNKIIWRWRVDVMKHFLRGENMGLVTARQCVGDWQYVFCTKLINEFNLTGTAGRFGSGNTFPLYFYPDEKNKDLFGAGLERVPNLNMEIINQIATDLGLTFTNEKEETTNTFAPIDLLDYIYSVLHSPTYREKYKEFLKIDFPRVPYPKDQETFWKLVRLGSEIRHIHLLESPVVENYVTGYPEDGDNVVTKPTYKNGHVYINNTQYFSNVPDVAWNFYIGGYQPAQKWLKDRKDRELSYEDILHYQKIIVALSETDRLMKEIDLIQN
jgi:predicted helicase